MTRLVCTLALVSSLVAVAPAAAQTARVSGSIADSTFARLPQVTVTAEHVDQNERNTTSVLTDRDGRYELRDLRPGAYTLTATLPGFETFTSPLTIHANDDVQRDVTLQVGMLQETVTVRTDDVPEPPRRADVSPASRPAAPQPRPSGAGRIGGNIKAPKMIVRVQPVYPSALAAQGVEGTVSLAAVIGVDGFVQRVQTVSSTNDDFAAAASAAVSQWQFTPTLLDGSPTEVRMKVSVNFRK